MSKYIDLEKEISNYYGTGPGLARHAGIRDALWYLDSYPEYVPVRNFKPTIKASEVTEAAGTLHAEVVTQCIEYMDLATVVPDPEPTNMEKLEEFIRVANSTGNGLAENLAAFLDSRGMHWGGTAGSATPIIQWMHDNGANCAYECNTEPCSGDDGGHVIVIRTLEGDMTATTGDYIIKGVQGEFYPCKPDIFHETYEEVQGS